MNTALEYSTRVVQEGDRRCKKSTLNDLAYLTPLRIPLMNPVYDSGCVSGDESCTAAGRVCIALAFLCNSGSSFLCVHIQCTQRKPEEAHIKTGYTKTCPESPVILFETI